MKAKDLKQTMTRRRVLSTVGTVVYNNPQQSNSSYMGGLCVSSELVKFPRSIIIILPGCSDHRDMDAFEPACVGHMII